MSRRKEAIKRHLKAAEVSDNEISAFERGSTIMIAPYQLEMLIDAACAEYHRQPVIKRPILGTPIKVTGSNFQAVLDALHQLAKTQD